MFKIVTYDKLNYRDDNMNKKGFTLVELIAVIAVLAIIITISVTMYGNTLSFAAQNLKILIYARYYLVLFCQVLFIFMLCYLILCVIIFL